MKSISMRNIYLIFSFLLLVACAVPKPAPVESRVIKPQEKSDEFYSNSDRRKVENNGFYTVQKGDTLFGIALAFGQNWRDIASWNSLTNPDRISIGQELRVKPPLDSANVARSIPLRSSKTEPAGGISSDSDNPKQKNSEVTRIDPGSEINSDTNTSTITSKLSWIWPANGQVIEQFSESNSKGISIAGVSGEAVYASGDGKVVYSGNGLRGYGNLVILKHKEDFISAYAHNQQILVNEGESVSQGQKIAEIGMTEAERPKLLFELRKSGKPIDPLIFLPKR